jgi:tRNA threonylcarbamoyladenosine modification (KEOPS) complex  Pcc1 subunit
LPITPEINKPVTRRVNAILEKEGAFLILKVEAKDTVALRATLNAYLRWVDTTANVIEVLEQAS